MVHARKQKPAAVNVYLPSRFDIVTRYIEVDFTFGLLDYVRYIENLDITKLRGNDQNVRYIEVIVND